MQADKKISVLLYGMSACFLFLAGALTHLQIFQGEKFRELALHNRIRRVALSAPRGVIYDRNGKILAGNRPSYDVELVLDEVSNVPRAVRDLAEILPVDPEEIMRKVKSGRYLPYLPVIVARDIGMENLTRLLETRKDLSGINIAVRAVRHYPNGLCAAHVLGTLGQISPGEYKRWKIDGFGPQDIVGKTGMESIFNRELVGEAGGMQVQVDNRGNKDKVLGYKIPVKGKDLTLTLDVDIQKTAEAQLAGKRGALVALDVKTGEVLAMVSAPAFDPTVFVESVRSKERQTVLLDRHWPMVNRAIAGVYPPGSVFKTIVGLAALQAKSINASTRFYCPGEFSLGETHFHCWRKHGHGTMDLEEALKYSCNVFFYHTGLETGQIRIEAMARAFGLGSRTGFLLSGESAGLLPNQAWKKKNGYGAWTKGDTVNFSIGQGSLLVTPLQMAVLGATFASGGIWRAPMIVRQTGEIEDSRLAPFAREIVLEKENIGKIRRGMVRVVNDKDATGYAAHLEGVLIAGKTGTVQTTSDRTNKKDHAWFVGFAPAENPRMAMAVVVEGSGSGGMVAAPVAREVMRAYFLRASGDAKGAGHP